MLNHETSPEALQSSEAELGRQTLACLMLYAIKNKESDLGGSLCDAVNADINFLEEENGSHGGKTKSTVDGAERRGGALLVAAAILLGALVSLLAGVDKSTLAGVVLALNELLLVEVLVEIAGVVQLSRRLEVESTLDVVELGSLNAGEVTAHVESTADALELREAVNLDKLGVVGNLEVTRDLGEKREGDVVELLVGDNGNGLTNAGKVGSGEGLETVVVETKRAVEGLERGNRDGTAETEGQVASPDEVG